MHASHPHCHACSRVAFDGPPCGWPGVCENDFDKAAADAPPRRACRVFPPLPVTGPGDRRTEAPPASDRSAQVSAPSGRAIRGPPGVGAGPANWRIVTDTPSTPETPAASLLFQAPAFQAPTFVEPAPAPASAPADDGPADRDDDKPAKGKKSKKKDKGDKPKSDKSEKGDKKKGAKKSGKKSDDAPESADQGDEPAKKSRSRRRGKGSDEGDSGAADAQSRGDQDGATDADASGDDSDEESTGTRRRRRRRSRSGSGSGSGSDAGSTSSDQVTALKGSTRLEAKKQRRREGRREGRRRQVITESEFLARRESVDRKMVIRHRNGLDQIAVLEDDLLVEHYVARRTQQSMVGNIYLGRVQNVLPSMEAAFVDVGRGRNAVLYAGEVNWDAVGLEGRPRRIESALKSGDPVLVQVTKDPIGHKGARLTSQITLAGRYLVLIPGASMMGISRKLPEGERTRLKKVLKKVVPSGIGVIVRTAAEGASEEQLSADVERLTTQWADIERKQKNAKSAPVVLRAEPELAVRVVRDIFNEDFSKLVISGKETYQTVSEYVEQLSPELSERVEQWTGTDDVFAEYRVDEQLAKGMDRKVWLPSGGTLIVDRTEAMTVIDVNTGKFIGKGGTLEETVTRNNLEAAEEIVRQLRLRDIGGIIIVDFVDMVLESNRDLVLRRLVECLGRDRTRHQVTEITSLGLVQMTRKRVGEGLVEAFSTTCETCGGRGFIVHMDPVEHQGAHDHTGGNGNGGGSKKGRGKKGSQSKGKAEEPRRIDEETSKRAKAAVSAIAAATKHADSIDEDAADAQSSEPVVQEKKPARRRATRKAVVAESAEPAKIEPHEGEQKAIIELPKPKKELEARAAESGSDGGAGAAGPAAAEPAAAEKPKRPRRRRAVSAEVVEPEAHEASIELPARKSAPAKKAASLDDIKLPEEHHEQKAPTKRRRRAVSTGVVDANGES